MRALTPVIAFAAMLLVLLVLLGCGRRDDGMGSLYRGVACKIEERC
jgi:hypothetical protein